MMSKASHQAEPFNLPINNAWLLWCCQLLNVACLTAELSSWMLAILALCFCWQALLLSKKMRVIQLFKVQKKSVKGNVFTVPPLVLIVFAISGCIAIALTAKHLGVLISMVHLLTFAYVLKTFEIKTRKDFYQHTLLGLFLLASALIFEQALSFSLLILLLLALNLTLIHKLFAKKTSLTNAGKTVVLLLLQSSLLAITLFLVFPRLSPFWQVPMAKSAKTGLSDNVSPGDIANLALSSELAFRVSFDEGVIPAYSTLYWRAMTLENYDGRKWTRSNNKIAQQHKNIDKKDFTPYTSGAALSYQVIAQPSFQPWLFSLPVATTTAKNIILKDDYTIQSSSIVNQLKYYQVQSYLDTPLALSLTQQSKHRNLAIKKGSNPKLEDLALTLKGMYSNPMALSQAVLTSFREQNYYYTLQPPALNNNSLDEFYFETRAGFCVHYASSFTYLMRAAGIPARIVTGYLGGEYNDASNEGNREQGGHLSIYQYDAHAWSEIWVEGIGWYRVDPTAAVDPERVNSGWSTALLEQQSSLNNNLLSLYHFKQLAWLNAIRLKLDAIDYQWTRWVLGYSAKQQYDLLRYWFGQQVPWKTAAIIAIALIIAMVVITLFYRVNSNYKKQGKITPAQACYNKCLLLLKKKGLNKKPHQTPLQFCVIVQDNFPAISSDFEEITKTFELLQYKQCNEQERHTLMGVFVKKTSNFIHALKAESTIIQPKQ